MRIRPRGTAEDCCCSSLKDNVKWLMERIGGTVRKLIINGNEYTPDGDGTVTLDTSAFVDVDDHLDDDSTKPIANKPVAEAVQELQDKNTLQDAAITDNAEDISDLQEATTGLADRIDANAADIDALQGAMAGMTADNVYTRSVAQGAADTANGLADRVADLETNDAAQQSQIGQLIVADQQDVKLTGDQTIGGVKTFTSNPKAAAPASGATDTSIVNANWISQSGDDAPNNVVHRNGAETIQGIKTHTSRIIVSSTGAPARFQAVASDVPIQPTASTNRTWIAFNAHDTLDSSAKAWINVSTHPDGRATITLNCRNADGTAKSIVLLEGNT